MIYLSDFNFTLMVNILSYLLHFSTYDWYFHIISENDEMARVALCDNPNWAPLSVLLGLVSCSVPIPLKAELLLTLAALAKTPSTAATLWHNLEASQILTTVPSTSSYQPRGIQVSKPVIYYKENIVHVYYVCEENLLDLEELYSMQSNTFLPFPSWKKYKFLHHWSILQREKNASYHLFH